MVNNTLDLIDVVRKHLEQATPDLLRELVARVVEMLMSADADARLQRRLRRALARAHQPSQRLPGAQLGHPGGNHRAGDPEAAQRQLLSGLAARAPATAERALIAVVAECYLLGVSTRRVENLVNTLGIERISKSQVSEMARSLGRHGGGVSNRPLDKGPYRFLWVDALGLRSRERGINDEPGRIEGVCALIATAVNAEGYREIVGLDVVTSEDGAGWLAFLRNLVARGLSGVQLVTSDSHPGLKSAIGATLNCSWQRCRTLFIRNLLIRVPRSAQQWVATAVGSIFAQPDSESVWGQHGRVVEALSVKFPAAAQMLADAAPDVLAFTHFPKEHWRPVWSNNPQERLNREIRRRTDLVGIFPNREAVIRLVVLTSGHSGVSVDRLVGHCLTRFTSE